MKSKFFFSISSLIILLMNDIKSQTTTTESKKSIGISLGSGVIFQKNQTNQANFFIFAPSFFISKNKHSIEIAPIFINNNPREYQDKGKYYGLTGSYSWFPNGNENRFNLLLKYQFAATFNIYSGGPWTSYDLKYGIPTYELKRQVLNQNYINSLLTGFSFNINKKFFAQYEVGIGNLIYVQKSKDNTKDYRLNSQYEDTYKYHGQIFPVILTKVSIGIRL